MTQQTVTVSALANSVVRYTTNGAEPIETDPEVPASGEVVVNTSMVLKARVFATERVGGAVTSAVYSLQPPTVSISPPTGSYTSVQSVSMTSSDASAVIHYTLDGSEPTTASTLYSSAFNLSISATVKAKAFKTGWTPSATSSVTLTLAAALNPPQVSPDGGSFQTPPQVTITADAGASIRYTLDGSDPTESSTLYSAPFSIPSGGATLKARAFQSGPLASDVTTEVFTLDTTAPTVTASVFPAANAAGWNKEDVTVSFECSDDMQMATCPAPVVVNQDGGDLLVSRTAVDAAGNETVKNVTIKRDTARATVAITTPSAAVTTAATQILVEADIADQLSGIASVRCNGIVASLSGDQATCIVPLGDGRNSVDVSVVDHAGNSSSASVRVNRVGTPTRISVTPSSVTLLEGRSKVVRVVNEFGVAVEAAWTSSDDMIAGFNSGVVEALAAGTTTLTATVGLLTAEMEVTVLAGTALPMGTTQWRLPSDPGSLTSPRLVKADPTDSSFFDYFAIETDSTGVEVVRAITADGQERERFSLPSGVSAGFGLASATGGFIVHLQTGLMRLGAPDGQTDWQATTGQSYSSVVQDRNGLIYAVGQDAASSLVDVIDGNTGQLQLYGSFAKRQRVAENQECYPTE